MNLAFLRSEILRPLRNPRYLMFTIGIPLVLFLVIGNAFDRTNGVDGTTWYMINMGVFGAMGAVLGTGARIAAERDAGWNRQLRLTPLTPQAYVVTKVVTSMVIALPSFLLVCAAGRLTGRVHLSLVQWGQLIGLSWLAMLPLAFVGVGLGYAARSDSAQAVNGGLVMLMSMFGGLWFPLDDAPRWIRSIADGMPTYWIGQISRAPLTHHWPAVGGWLVLAAWAGVALRIASRRYRVDAVRAV